MIPTIENSLSETLEISDMPSKQYKVNYTDRIYGFNDNLEAMKQTCYKILLTERYKYVIYDWNYGIELDDLFGESMTYVIPEVQRRIIEALAQDNRIESVDNFSFDTSKRHELAVEFTVHTIYGDFDMEKSINV
jgi:hypothetical protein